MSARHREIQGSSRRFRERFVVAEEAKPKRIEIGSALHEQLSGEGRKRDGRRRLPLQAIARLDICGDAIRLTSASAFATL